MTYCVACNKPSSTPDVCSHCGVLLGASTFIGPGRTLHHGEYTLTRSIGVGAFSSVYLARQSSLSRDVAIKLLRPRWSTDRAQGQRFRAEVRATSYLTHPAVVQVYSFGEEPDHLLWFSMELLQGETLSEYLRRMGPIAPWTVVEMLGPVLELLAEVHKAGIVHRDPKPENLFLSSSHGRRTLRLLDFSIAHFPDEPWESEDGVAGTPRYMSPEQWRSLQATDHRSDIYILGGVVYECLCGRVPFEANEIPEWARAHTSEEPQDLAELMPQAFPSGLPAAVMKALRKDPDERYQTMLEFKNALEQALRTDLSPRLTKAPQKEPPQEDEITPISDDDPSIIEELPSPPPQVDPWIGKTLGEFLIERFIQADEDRVYRGRQLTSLREVSLKLHHQPLSSLQKENFLTDARLISALSDPRVIRVLGFGAEDDFVWWATEFVGDETLRLLLSLLTNKPPKLDDEEVRETARLFGRLCEVLASSHASGVLLKQIKPESIFLLRAEPYVKLDVDLCRDINLYADPEADLWIRGDPAYLPPEQWHNPRKVDARSDIYVLGGVLYEVLSGRRLFEAGSILEWAKAHTSKEPQPLSEVSRGVPPSLSQVVMRALQKSPDERYQTALDFKAALLAAVGLPSLDGPPRG